MNANWWVMYQMFQAREREIRIRIAHVKPWSWEQRAAERKSHRKGGVKRALGKTLISWGSALISAHERDAQTAKAVTPAVLATDTRLRAR